MPVMLHVAEAVHIVPVDAPVEFGHRGEGGAVGVGIAHEQATAEAAAHQGGEFDGCGLVVEAHDGFPDGAEVEVDKDIYSGIGVGKALLEVVVIVESDTAAEEPVLADVDAGHDVEVGGMMEFAEVVAEVAGFAGVADEGGIAGFDLDHEFVLGTELRELGVGRQRSA